MRVMIAAGAAAVAIAGSTRWWAMSQTPPSPVMLTMPVAGNQRNSSANHRTRSSASQ